MLKSPPFSVVILQLPTQFYMALVNISFVSPPSIIINGSTNIFWIILSGQRMGCYRMYNIGQLYFLKTSECENPRKLLHWMSYSLFILHAILVCLVYYGSSDVFIMYLVQAWTCLYRRGMMLEPTKLLPLVTRVKQPKLLGADREFVSIRWWITIKRCLYPLVASVES